MENNGFSDVIIINSLFYSPRVAGNNSSLSIVLILVLCFGLVKVNKTDEWRSKEIQQYGGCIL